MICYQQSLCVDVDQQTIPVTPRLIMPFVYLGSPASPANGRRRILPNYPSEMANVESRQGKSTTVYSIHPRKSRGFSSTPNLLRKEIYLEIQSPFIESASIEKEPPGTRTPLRRSRAVTFLLLQLASNLLLCPDFRLLLFIASRGCYPAIRLWRLNYQTCYL